MEDEDENMECEERYLEPTFSSKKRLKSLSLREKLQIVDRVNLGEKRKDLAKEYGVNNCTICRIIKQETKIRTMVQQNRGLSRKKIRTGKHEIIDEALFIWYQKMKTKNMVLNGPILLRQAQIFSTKLNLNFEINGGWFDRWKKRNNISFKTVPESPKYTFLNEDTQRLATILEVLDKFKPNDIFNADETSLLYKAVPNFRASGNNEPRINFKKEESFTVLLITNMNGSERHAHIIGRIYEPCCFDGKHVPLPYYSNCKAWMTNDIWIRILKDLNKTMSDQNRRIALFVDNAECHKLEDHSITLTNIELLYLPTRMRQPTQPLSNGITKIFKAYYRQDIIKKQLSALEREIPQEEFLKSIDLLKAISMVREIWWSLQSSVIKRSFHKCGFIFSNKKSKEFEEVKIINERIMDNGEPELAENGVCFINIGEEANPLNIKEEFDLNIDSYENNEIESEDENIEENEYIEIPEMTQINFMEYLEIDGNIKCFGDLNDDEIILECQNPNGYPNTVPAIDDLKIEEKNNRIITKKEILSSLDTLKHYLKQNMANMVIFNELEEQITQLVSSKSKMVKICLNRL